MRVKSYLVLLSLALMLIVPQLVIAANPVHNFDCKNCHLSGLTINELGGANVCITCHGATPATVNMNLRPPATSDAGFVTGDASAQYGNNPVPLDETSHNWAATSTNPAAGAAEPVRALYPGFFSRYGTTVGKTACSRCHDPHGDFDTNKKLLPLTADNATPMTPNEMCLACHKTFGDSVQASHGLLSHPMVTDYATFQGGDATNYKAVTEDSSTAPDAYANGVQLVNGDISCLSCHNLHFTDSDSDTADGPLANPTNGDGLLLRGDGTQFVNDAAKANTFCTTCHNLDPAASMHGSATVDMGCMGCHGGHNYNDNNPSYFMLIDNYTELPIGTEFNGTAKREDLWGGTQLGVVDGFCETCHGDIADPPFNGVRVHTQGEDCSACHLSHAEGAFSKPIGCDGCHGSPPRVNAPGNIAAGGYVLNGYAWAPDGSNSVGVQYDYLNDSGHFKDETTTPHASHAGTPSRYSFSCQVCHNTHITDFAGTHNKDNSSFRDVLETGYTFDSKSVAPGAADPLYNDAAASCDNVYCHSNGGVNGGTGTRTFNFTQPGWDGTKDTIVGQATECSSCHGNDSTSMTGSGNSAAHQAHLGQGYDCNICHVDTASSGTALQPGAINVKHMNQLVDVVFDESSILKAGGSNVAHGASPWGGPGNVTCSAVYCHSSGQDAVPGDRVYKSITWTSSGPLTCTSCHDITVGTDQTAAHAAHVSGSASNVGRDLDCAVCHDDTMNAGNNTAIAAAAFHVNGQVDVAMPASIDPNQNCSTSLCHSDGNLDSVTDHAATANPKNNTPAWTLADTTPGTFNACDKCHGDDATNKAYPAYADGDVAGNDANSHNAHVGSSAIECDQCHSDTSISGTSLDGDDPTQHVDQTVDVKFRQNGTFNGDDTCSTTYCHGTGPSPAWGDTTPLLCSTCHNASVALADSHPAHYESATVAVGSDFTAANNSTSTEYIFNCGNCHSGTNHAGGEVSTNQAAEVSLDGTGTYTADTATLAGTDRGFNYTAGSCSANDCHNDGTAAKGAPNMANPQWTVALAADCTGCHDNNAAAASAMASVSHAAHMNDGTIMADKACESCHTVTVDNTDRAIVDKSQHANQVRNVDIDANWDSNAAPGDNWDGANCTNVYCHSDAQGTYQAVAWGATISDCVSCHDTTGATTTLSGAHKAHTFGVTTTVGKDLDCGECHADTVTVGNNSAITGATAHVDKTNTIKVAIDNSTCNNIQCHSDGNVGNLQYNNPAWGTTLDCFNCHGNGTDQSYPSYADGGSTTVNANSHNAHVGSSTIKCEECHSNTSTAGTSLDGATPSVHVDQNIDMAFKQGGTFNVDETCSTTYCHGTGPSPAWGDTSPLVCNTCHNASNALADSHPAHYESATVAVGADFTAANNSITGEYIFNCGNCHSTGISHAGGAVSGVQAAEVILSGSGSYTANSTAAAASPDRGFAFTDGSCGTNDCHNDGTAAKGAPNTIAPQWTGSLAADCTGCHNNNAVAASAMASVSHAAHMNDGTIMADKSCESCHTVTVDNTDRAIADKSQHANQVRNVDIDANWDSNATPGDNWDGANCTNVYCHSDAQGTYQAVAWGATISDCISCHDTTGATTTLSGAHKAHTFGVTTTVGKDLDCGECHADTVTVGANSVITGATAHVDKTNTIKVAIDNSTCNNIQCHSDGNLDSTLVYNNPAWGTTLDCFNCHGNGVDQSYPSYADGNNGTGAANSHNAHVGSSAIECDQCHSDTSISGTSLDGDDPTQHVDQTIDVKFRQNGTFNGDDTCSATYCHGTGPSPAWGDTAPLACNTCHNASVALADSHPAHYESATVAVGSDFTAANNSSTTEYIFNCGNCHSTGISHAGGAVSGVQAAEVILAGSGTYAANATAAAASPDRGFAFTDGTCGTNDCHNDGTAAKGAPNTAAPQWTGTLAATCTGCHNNNVASGNAMATGAHTKHINNANNGASKACQSCHSATVDNTDRAISDKSVHVNTLLNVAILGSLDGGNNAYAGSCNAVYCHSTGQSTSNGSSATPTYATATWATPASGACGTCHKVTEATGLTSGSHGAHLGTSGVNGCADCHTGALNDASAYNSTNHVNTLIDVANTYTLGGAPGNGYGTCSTASCHDDGTGTAAVTPQWGTAGGCASCHASDMVSGSHDNHLLSTINQSAISCGNCHDSAVKDTTAPTEHLNNLVDVYNSATGDFGGSYLAGKAKGSAYGSCATTYCHGDTLAYSAGDGIDTSPLWGSTQGSNPNNCDVCHGFPPDGGGSHPTNNDCNACHFHANATNTGFDDVTLHIDRIIQIDGGDACLDCHASVGGYKSPDSGDHLVHTVADTLLAGKGLVAGDYGSGAYWYDVTYDAAGRPLMGCGQCHPATESTHLDGTLQTDLDPAGEAITAPNAKLGSQPGAAYSGGTCSSVYCHSNGDGAFADSPSWDATGGNAGIDCASCHGNSPTTAAHGVHEVGIHYAELYDSATPGILTPTGSVGSGAAHGDTDVSTTINCFTCHNGTVTDSANAGNATCNACHSDNNNILVGDELARIQVSSTVHLNGAKDVTFADLSAYKTKAQLRDNLSDADDGSNILSDIWNRITGYKGATDYDQPQAAFATPVYASGTATCSTVACHNNNDATWATPANDCMTCHTSLPK